MQDLASRVGCFHTRVILLAFKNINIHITSMNTDNIDSLTKSDCNIVQTIPVDSNQSQIMFTKTNDYAFTIKEDCIDSISVTTTDDLGESIDWNNQHWNMTLYFTTSYSTISCAYCRLESIDPY